MAYRALDFLMEHGFAHKIERLNAFIAYAHPGENHAPTFMICRLCETVAEAQSGPARSALAAAARATVFQIERTVVENLSNRYGLKTMLWHVSLAVSPGEIVTIPGPK